MCTIHYLSTDGTAEEYYADVPTIIEKNGIVKGSKEVVAQKSRRVRVFFFLRRRRFDVWGVAGGMKRKVFR